LFSCTIFLTTVQIRGTEVLTIGTGAVFPTALGELNAVNRFVALPLLLFADSLLAEAGVWAPPVSDSCVRWKFPKRKISMKS
jgi:hypothetical protein